MNTSAINMTIQELMEFLGCNQQELAELLGISRRTLQYAITGERALPDEAVATYKSLMEKVSDLLPSVEHSDAGSEDSTEYDLVQLRRRLRWIEGIVRRLEAELAVIQTAYQKSHRSVELIKALGKSGLKGCDRMVFREWLSAVRVKSELYCSRNNLCHQAELEAHIAGIRSEAEHLKAFLKRGEVKRGKRR